MPEAGSDGEGKLDQDDEGDAVVQVEEAKERAKSAEGLACENAAADGGRDVSGDVLTKQLVAGGTAPAEVEDQAEKENVGPVSDEGGAVLDELREQAGGKGHQGNGEEKSEVNPGEVTVGTADVIELSLLADPENSEGQEAEEINEKLGGERRHAAKQIVFGVNGFTRWSVEFEEEESHSHEDAVA